MTSSAIGLNEPLEAWTTRITMGNSNTSWGELRSIIHSGGDASDLTRVLEQWPGSPDGDEALQDYLRPHSDLWTVERGALPCPELLEHWLRGKLRFLLEICAPDKDWTTLSVCRALDVGEEWAPPDTSDLGFFWTYAPIYQFADGYQWTLRRARTIEVSSEPRFEPEGSDILSIIKQFNLHGETYGAPETPHEVLEIDILCEGIVLGEGWDEIPCCAFTATIFQTQAWMQGVRMSPERWVAMFELWWQLARRSLVSDKGPLFCDEEENLVPNAPFLTESWDAYRQIRGAIVRPL